ncbi:hypothetical protein DAPPUDRAFT_314512 [Daphnia pulex]|uniref:HMG box domain-containing protein n=1 Tax=Daphnia pulex TaxID=6669 RepID=E9G6E2_DAPPU|nr:hypothetical protein DAPPUDRAFT_314512 [Daphnia pulex]|eukprot:EFX85008.1 hypothetical protein DAPPUDRAFT_314512 [Daphnia pulex]
MANKRKEKKSRRSNLHDAVASTSSVTEQRNRGSEKPEVPSSPIPDEHSNSPLAWPKSDDFELFKRIRKACPKEDAMKYDSRVNHLNWDSIKFQDYSAEQCLNRWLYVQIHLRHYRILAEVLDDAESWVDTPWCNFNKGGKNNQKHPDQPKKPLTSYLLFYMKQKDAVLKKQPGLGMTELNTIIAKMYHKLSDQKKTEYSELAKKEKEAYQEKMKKFMDAHPDYRLPKSKQTSKAVPPKPPTPLRLFSDINMPKFSGEGMTMTEAREKCRDAYKELKDKQKLTWIYQALEQEPEFNEEMEKFRMQHPDLDFPAKRFNLLTKDEIKIKNKYEGKPSKPPNSGYNLFTKELLSNNKLKDFETTERMGEIARLWKEDMSDEQKTSCNERAKQMNESYKIKYASYLETLTPEHRHAELLSSDGKAFLKQMAAKKAKDGSKKLTVGTQVSSEIESDEEETEIELQIPSLMFRNSNMDNTEYSTITKQELARLVANLSEETKVSDQEESDEESSEDSELSSSNDDQSSYECSEEDDEISSEEY